MSKALLFSSGIVLTVSAFLCALPGAPATATLAALPATAVDSAAEHVSQVVLWNQDYHAIADFFGDWEVQAAPHGSRMRPRHEGCRVRLYSSIDGLVREYSVPSAGEVYLAFGWICVNPVDQQSWTQGVHGSGASISATNCGDDLTDCTASYPKDYVSSVTFNVSNCWRDDVNPPEGCEYRRVCLAGSQGCQMSVNLIDGSSDPIEATCGSGATMRQCADGSNTVWVCYCA